MTLEEINTGDWVIYETCHDRIVGIDQKKQRVQLLGEPSWYWIPIRELSGVNITQEILKLNHWEITEEEPYGWSASRELPLGDKSRISATSETLELTIRDSHGNTRLQKKLKFIHELQECFKILKIPFGSKMICSPKDHYMWFMVDFEGTFSGPDDIPGIPGGKIPEKDYQLYIVQRLTKAGAIPKKDLIPGKKYLGSCRNATEAVWKESGVFEYIREKIGQKYPEEINHFEDDDGYDLFIPIKELS